jgi:hypothetical protein
MDLKKQIENELKRTKVNGATIKNIKESQDLRLVFFTIQVEANDKDFWARLTPTGRLKKNSIRIS